MYCFDVFVQVVDVIVVIDVFIGIDFIVGVKFVFYQEQWFLIVVVYYVYGDVQVQWVDVLVLFVGWNVWVFQ